MNNTKDNWIVLNDEAINNIREAIAQEITQGEIMLRASCPRKWYYRYALQLERRGFLDFNLVYGSLMHQLLEELYRDGTYQFLPWDEKLEITDDMMAEATDGLMLSPKQLEEAELVRKKVQIHFDAYRIHYHRPDSRLIIEGVEKVLKFVFHGLNLVGKVDLIAKPNRSDGICIWDFKTAGQLDAMSLDAWTFKFQFLFYCWLYWKVTGRKPTAIMTNGLVKSQLRPRMKNRKTKELETEEEYLFRMKGEMAKNRERYFYRQRIPLGTDALERFEEEILMPHVDAFAVMQGLINSDLMIKEVINALAFQMNTNHCHVYKSYCEYLSLCKDGLLAQKEFDQREFKHSEI
jgi:hypothetical protein